MISIKSIEFFNHEIFGSQKFSFTKDDGNPFKNIIIAGENGSGKTRFLEELYYISNTIFYLGNPAYSKKTHEITIDLSTENYCNFENEKEKINEAILTIYKNDSGTISNSLRFVKNDKEIQVKKLNSADMITSLNLNGLYSGVEINYKARRTVQGPDNKTLENGSTKIPDDMAYEIMQLLVNISAQDSYDMDSWVGAHRDLPVPDEIYHQRLKRFTNAFSVIWGDSIEYRRVEKNSIPLFQKGNNEIPILSLSSGEKQIIFRGTYLLQNKNSLKGVPVFIDEPEISMHPKWEEKILNYYKNIFSEDSIQTSQIFVATHSEHVLSSALKEEDCLVIKIKNNSCEKFYKDGPGIVLPTLTIAEIKYAIFDLYTTDFHSLLYGHIQENYVEDCSGNILLDPNVKQTDEWLKTQNVSIKPYHKLRSSGTPWNYETLPSYIRNCIDHPDPSITYSDSELATSIEELRRIINNHS